MRIIHTDTDDIENPLRGGQPVRTFEINSRLSADHQIKILTASYKGSKTRVKRGRLDYERLGITIPGWGLSSHLSFLNRLPAAIKRTPHDLIVEEFTPPFGFCNLQKHSSAPVISIVQWYFFNDWQKRYKLPFEAFMQKRAPLFSPRNMIVQTHKMGEHFKALLPNANITKIPCGIQHEALHAPESSGDYALFLGRLDTAHKGLDDLLQAWHTLAQSGVKIPLWIVGAGKDEQALKALSESLNLTQLVSFKGRLEGKQKKAALKHCRFLVMPSRQETFGITALEAMACGKPVIAYDIDHLNELLNPAWSVLVPCSNVRRLAEAIAQLWQSQQTCLAMGEHAFTEAKNYLWDVLAKQQEAFYLSVLEQKRI